MSVELTFSYERSPFLIGFHHLSVSESELERPLFKIFFEQFPSLSRFVEDFSEKLLFPCLRREPR